MTEQEWLTSADPLAMFEYLMHGQADDNCLHCPSDRKLWLVFFAQERLALTFAPPTLDGEELAERRLMLAKCEAGERFADGLCSAEDVFRARWPKKEWSIDARVDVYRDLRQALRLSRNEEWKPGAAEAYSDVVREIVGNPWAPPQKARTVVTAAADMSAAALESGASQELLWQAPWLTREVLAIAQGIYEDRTYSECPVLADALEEAGCNEEPLLRHLRGYEPCRINYGTGFHMTPRDTSIAPWKCDECHGEEWVPLRGGHVRGCWALDVVLGKE